MKLTILGSGSPEAYARRASSGYLVEIGADKLLFDVGGGVFDNLLRVGLVPGDITHLFLSHLHSDHMMDYARLVHAAWDEGAAPLNVYGPEPIARITRQLFGDDGVFSTDLRARTELPQSQEVWVKRGGTLPRAWPKPKVQEITAGFSMNTPGWSLRTAGALHAQPFLDCLAFALDAGGKTLVYSGDTGITDETRALCSGADFLLHWCYRLETDQVSAQMAATSPTPQEIAAMARAAGVKKLVLTHFRKHMDGAFDPAILRSGDLAKMQTEVAEDLATYQI